MNLGHVLTKIFERFPETNIKNKIRYFLAFNKYVPKSISDLSPIKGYELYYNLKRGDFVVDAGAYTGDYTIFAAKKVGKKGKIIAFEPDEKNRKVLKRNLKKENIKNVIIIPFGLWGENTYYNLSGFNGLHSSISENKKGKQIKVVKLDYIIRRLNLKKLDFIKMDIEGAEIEAIKGSIKTLKKFRPNLAIASYHIINGKPTSIFLETFFSKIGYKVKSDFQKHLTTYASF